jgi:TNF receptor-associated protein 1
VLSSCYYDHCLLSVAFFLFLFLFLFLFFSCLTFLSIGLTSAHGSKITMHLKESCEEFSDPERIKSIIKHYSSFVSFPIRLNGEIVNTVGAIWLKDKKEITSKQYNEFYKFVSNAFDTPKFTLHFRTDAPIDLKCILFTPSFHSEKLGMGVMEPGVHLYSRKILIESKPKDLLPDWLRFLKGVVDSEDLPLSLSREKPQDSSLLRRIKEVLTRKYLKFLEDEMKNNFQSYHEFYVEYNMFLKQGNWFFVVPLFVVSYHCLSFILFSFARYRNCPRL